MSSSSSDANSVAILANVTAQMNRYLGIFIFIFGFVGNTLNILVFRHRTLRTNPCAWFFLASSVGSLIYFSIGLLTRILSGWNLDYSAYNQVICKIRGFLVYVSAEIIAWFIAMATVNRWLSSSRQAHLRQMDTLKNAQRCTIILLCVSAGLNSPMFYCYDANLINSTLPCYLKSLECLYLGSIITAFPNILCPLIVIVLFGLLTVKNIRQFHRQMRPMNTIELPNIGNQNRQQRKIDRQLLLMLFFQDTLLTILLTPLFIQRLYATSTFNNSKTALQTTIEQFIDNLLLLLNYAAFALPFFIYTLAGGSTFRKALVDVLLKFRRIILHQ
jgi:hypothetical protein